MSDHDFADLANRAWRVFEPIHAVTYFSEESRRAAEAAGLRGWFMGYFGFRSAPLGPVPASVVEATFFNFHRSRVERAIPDAWAFASVEDLPGLRAAAVATALGRLCGAELLASTLPELVPLLGEVAATCDCAGRPLAAANQALPQPDDDAAAAWQLITVLREHRGDGHIACLTFAGLDGCEALVMHAASGAVPADVLRTSRNWPEAEWDLAVERLAGRGLMADGAATPAGLDLRHGIESDTNRLAAQPYAAMGPERTERLIELLRPVARAVVKAGGFPSVNPIGLDASDE